VLRLETMRTTTTFAVWF